MNNFKVSIGSTWYKQDVYTGKIDIYNQAKVIDLKQHNGKWFARMTDLNGNLHTAVILDSHPAGYTK